MTVAARFDAPRPGSAALDRRVNPISGALEVRYPLTWTGVRTYRHADGRVTRELRRPEQVFAPSHLRTLRRLVATIGHPQLEDGTQVFLDARGGPGVADPDGTALRPAEDYQVGHTGDEIEREEVGGYPVPVAWCSVTSQRAQRMIAGGALQSSLGYLAYLDIHDTPQVWDGPSGPELYDVEHVLDHEDPRVLAAMARGEVRVARAVVDGAEVDVPVLGGNHLAIAIRAGRGGLQSEVRLDACCDACREGDEICDGAGCALPGAWSAGSPATRLQRAEDSAARWAVGARAPLPTSSWGGVLLGLAPGLPVDLPSRDLCGELEGEWRGWLAEGGDGEASPWVAFARADGLLLAWPRRAEDGSIDGPPCVVARESRDSREIASRAAARADLAAYAAPVAPTAPLSPEPPAAPKRIAQVMKLTLSPKIEKAAGAVAQALGAGAPSRKADALEIELPETMDPAMVLAALQAVCSALEGATSKAAGLEGQVASLETAKAEADKLCGDAMAEAQQYKADCAALRADAEEGRRVRLEKVKAQAKARIAGLTDADLEGDADQVRKAAIARWVPKAGPRLDAAPAMLDALWDALLALPELGKPTAPVAPKRDSDEERAPVKIVDSAPTSARRLTAHNPD